MIWLLILIALLLVVVVVQIADASQLGRRLHDIHMTKVHEDMQEIMSRLIDIEMHTARTAQPFYDADQDRLRHPERYFDE